MARLVPRGSGLLLRTMGGGPTVEPAEGGGNQGGSDCIGRCFTSGLAASPASLWLQLYLLGFLFSVSDFGDWEHDSRQ